MEKEDKLTPEKLIYDFFLDESRRLGERTDWFLIFHAILLKAFFSAKDSHAVRHAQTVVALVGWLTAYIWFMTGFRQRWLSRHLGQCLIKLYVVNDQVAQTMRISSRCANEEFRG